MTDQIADLLTRIRNSVLVGKHEIVLPSSKMREVLLNVLKKEAFIDEIKPVTKNGKKFVKIIISATKLPTHLKQISRPGQRIYVKSKEIPRPLRGLGLVIISTPQGVITGREALKRGLGGELICEVW